MPTEPAATEYTCPMHPEVRQNQPGSCPKCGMPLVPVKEAPPPGSHSENHAEMLRTMRAPWLWTNFTVIALGVWLMTSPVSLGYGDPGQLGEGAVRVTTLRHLSSLASRGHALALSDLVSGALLVLLGTLSLRPRLRTDFWGRWGVCFVGIWLQFAPLVFWSPSLAGYLNDTLVGALVIGFSVLVPMMPGMAHHMAMMQPGPAIPPGWTYNPSSWLQRGPVIALGFVGWFISRYLAAWQLGYISSVWDPFFTHGTRLILDSKVSRSWPISDAGLGATAYTFEVLMGFMGGVTRWRSMPWMVTFFGILVVPLGLTSIILVILQPLAVGTWCTLCLAAALAMLFMIPLTLDEVVAMLQFMAGAHREGKPLWRTFWVGGTIEGGGADDRSPRYGAAAGEALPAMVWGVSAPWTLVLSAALGLWIMAAPAIFHSGGRAADGEHLIGALVVTTSVVVMAEVVRAGRLLDLLFGLWLIVAPWLLAGASTGARVNDVLAGVALILLSLPRGSVRERYGRWDRAVL